MTMSMILKRSKDGEIPRGCGSDGSASGRGLSRWG